MLFKTLTQLGVTLGMLVFTMGKRYRLHPARFKAREDLRVKIMLEEW